MGSRRRPILIVDDDEELAAMAARYLRHHGWLVEVMCDPRVALDEAPELEPCLLLVDLMMPHLDGEELVRALRSSLRDACPPVCILSAAYARAEVARRIDAEATLGKPFELEDLRDLAVRFCAEHRDRMTSIPP